MTVKVTPRASALDRLIAPEIRRDGLARWLRRIAATPGVRTILEIGSSSGDGSTSALVAGALENPEPPAIHCIEVSALRFDALARRFQHHAFVHCHHLSSVALDRFATELDVERFYKAVRPKLRRPPLTEILGWLRQDIEYVTAHHMSDNGIRRLRRELGLSGFDAVLIDGSEFTGRAELEDVYGARFLLLDDILAYKNYETCRGLEADPRYRRLAHSRWRRNGYAVFAREGTA